MPKGKTKDLNRPDTRRMVAPITKFKIGNRKSTRSAYQLNNDELRKIAVSDRGRDAQTARNELTRRKVPLVEAA